MPLVLRVSFFALGLLAVAVAFWSRIANSRARSWPATRGRILRCEIGPNAPAGRQRRLHLLYEYEVGAQHYRGDRLQFASRPASVSWWKSILARYPAGAEVDVYYDPDQPENAVLIRPADAGGMLIGAVGLVFMAFAYLLP